MTSIYSPGLVFLLSSLVYLSQSQTTSGQAREKVTDVCLGCICEAISGCNLTRGCEDDDCGMFRITKSYWIDSGMPTLHLGNPHAEGAYKSCVTDPECAATTVRGYMSRFINKDCNGDSKVDCMDYAAMHYHSGYFCNRPLDPGPDSVMRNCLAQFSGLDNKRQ